MAVVRMHRSAAAVSWISPHTGLPEVDHNQPYPPTTTRAFLTGDQGFRFCNFVDVWAEYDTTAGRFVGHNWSSQSKIYRGPSYMGISSHVFPKIANVVARSDSVTFTQVVGARTVSPEVIGSTAGGAAGATAGGGILPYMFPIPALVGWLVGSEVGESVAHRVKGFPPIWTEVQLTIFASGSFDAQLLRYSYFPSLTFFAVRLDKPGNQTNDYDRVDVAPNAAYYDAIPKLDHWNENGWGSLGRERRGPTNGNPWRTAK